MAGDNHLVSASPVRYLSSYRTKFDAGHRYTVDIEWTREGAAGIDLDEWQRAKSSIDALTAELRNRDLAKMLGPHHPSVFGVAAFFMERLSIIHPITRVRIHESDGPTAIIEVRPDY